MDLKELARDWAEARKALLDHYDGSADLKKPPADLWRVLSDAEDRLYRYVHALTPTHLVRKMGD